VGAPFRIVHVEYGIGFGGSIVSLSELVRALEATGRVESTVVTFQPASVVGGLFREGAVVRIPILLSYRTRQRLSSYLKRGPIRRLLRGPALKAYAACDWVHDRYVMARLRRVARSRHATHVHVNNGVSASALGAARTLGIPCIAHFRGFVEGDDTLSHLFPTSPHGTPPTVHCCIGISDSVTESVIAAGVPRDLIHTLHNPVSLDRFTTAASRRHEIRTRYRFGENELVIGVFGRITPWKGQLEFLEAIEPLLRQWDDVRVLLVGDESDGGVGSYNEAIRAVLESTWGRDRVLITGFQRDVEAFYAAVDIVVHCSVTPEPFGRVVIEGMAAGRAVVAMAEGGPPEIISNGYDGLLVAPRHAEAMRAALRSLRSNAELRRSLGANAVETVKARFAPGVSAERFLALLAGRAIDSSPAGARVPAVPIISASL
jgi:glycosyltransferase involved in cell wall biosynthesis